jgi:hypothetical protein
VADTDSVPVIGNSGPWSTGAGLGSYFSAGPRHTRNRLIRQDSKLAYDEPLQIESAAREVVACPFYYDKLCFCGDHVKGGAHFFDRPEWILSSVHE